MPGEKAVPKVQTRVVDHAYDLTFTGEAPSPDGMKLSRPRLDNGGGKSVVVHLLGHLADPPDRR
jgi:hypothetical protein